MRARSRWSPRKRAAHGSVRLYPTAHFLHYGMSMTIFEVLGWMLVGTVIGLGMVVIYIGLNFFRD